MAETTGIAWTDSTFNPVIGCQRVSPGCELCYAEIQDSRKRWEGRAHWGPTAPRYRTSVSNWNKPLAWNRAAEKLQRRHLVFCASLSDVFEDHPTWAETRPDLWRLIEATPALTWLLLTKRPQNVRTMVPSAWMGGGWPAHVWPGTTTEDRKRFAERVPHLRALPAPVRWLSIEPQLEDLGRVDLVGINWAIVGGESDMGAPAPARVFDLQWARSIRAQCREQGVAYFFKQKGSNVVDNGRKVHCTGKGDVVAEFPEDVRGREFPKARAA